MLTDVVPAPIVLRSGVGLAALRVLLILAVGVAFSNSLAVPFLLDDLTTILRNPTITNPASLSSVLFPPPEIYSAGRPLLNLSFALNHAIGGTAVRGYHVLNLAIHAIAALVLFGVLRRTMELPLVRAHWPGASLLPAFLIAGMWAVHPLQVSSVTYISQRAESLMGLFYLLTLYCFLRAVGGGAVFWKIGSMVACLAGMATKEVMITAPVVVFLFDATCVAGSYRQAWTLRWRLYAGLSATWLVLGALMISSELGRRAVGVEHGLSWFDYARIESVALTRYLRLALWPAPLVFDYGPNLPFPSWTEFALRGGMLLGLLAFALRRLVQRRVSGFLFFAFFLLLAPTSSVIPVAGQPIAENRMYLPLALVLTAVVTAGRIGAARAALAPFAAAIVGLGIMCHARNADFRTDVNIWRDTVAKQPVNKRAWVYYSHALTMAGRNAEATEVLLEALRHHPQSPELENNVAVALFTAGRVDESIQHFQSALRLKSDYEEAYYNFGAVLYKTGNLAPALECFNAVLTLKPRSVEGHNYAGLCHAGLGRPDAAIPHFQRALDLDPNHAAARQNLETAKAKIRTKR